MRVVTLTFCMLIATTVAQAQTVLLTDQEQSCITAASVITSLPFAEVEGTVSEESINFPANSYYLRSGEVHDEWLRLLEKTNYSLKAYPETKYDIQSEAEKAGIALRSDDTKYLDDLFSRALDCRPVIETLY